VSKALNQIEDIDEVSVTPPPPPPGYELIPSAGDEIRYRTPDGSEITFDDLVASGYYGDDDKEDDE
jgi:hypothetical protein